MIKKFINIEFRLTNGLIISRKLIIVSYSAYQSILNEENYREFVEAENMELLSDKIIEYSKKNKEELITIGENWKRYLE